MIYEFVMNLVDGQIGSEGNKYIAFVSLSLLITRERERERERKRKRAIFTTFISLMYLWRLPGILLLLLHLFYLPN